MQAKLQLQSVAMAFVSTFPRNFPGRSDMAANRAITTQVLRPQEQMARHIFWKEIKESNLLEFV